MAKTLPAEKHVAWMVEVMGALGGFSGGVAYETTLNITSSPYSVLTGSGGPQIHTSPCPPTHGMKPTLTSRLDSVKMQQATRHTISSFPSCRTARRRKSGGTCP
ncbi:hypothetical protein ACLK2I_13785 [Escherichia coli]